MKRYIVFGLVLIGIYLQALGQEEISSSIDSTDRDNVILKQEVIIHATLQAVWDAYTTVEGWSQWASPLVKIDLRNGGSILSNYNKDGTIGDATTNTLRIVNYVPLRMLCLQSDINANFPEITQAEEDAMYGITMFEDMGEGKTKLTSYGVGYKLDARFRKLMGFFINGNEWSYGKLKGYLE